MKSLGDVMYRPVRFQDTGPTLQVAPMLLTSHVSASQQRQAVCDARRLQARGLVFDRLREAGFMEDR